MEDSLQTLNLDSTDLRDCCWFAASIYKLEVSNLPSSVMFDS